MIQRLLSTILLLLPLSNLHANPAQSSYDLLAGGGLSPFQPTSGWMRVNSATAVDGNTELMVDISGNALLVNHPVPLPREFISGVGASGTFTQLITKDKSIPYLLTRRTFGDVHVELEFMIPKDSNAGVYLMGRYEVQILDSFGKAKVGSGDLGGIYQRWDKTKPKDQQWTEGTRPKANAAKAPGEWQTMDIVFHAPRFDAQGIKTQDATFESVRINGILVQENATTTGPTASAPLTGEAMSGPISIQGDHGPIAIRNFKATPLPCPATTQLEELNAYWAKVSHAVNTGDYEEYGSTCHDTGVVVAGSKQASYPLKQALARWKTDFEKTKSGAVKSQVEFRFDHRYGDATTAHESGMFCYTSQVPGEEPVADYIALEALLTKQDGQWKILMEYQKGKTTKEEWDALAPQS